MRLLPRLPFAARVRLAFLAALLAVAAAAAAAAFWLRSPWAVLALALLAGLTLGLWLLERVLGPATRTLRALRDGVQGYRDHDFSLSLAADRRDELGELVSLYNSVGDVLREERGNLLQRELLLETVLEATPMAIVLTRQDRIFFVNRAARELFVTGRRLEGQPFASILEECPPRMREVLESGRDALFSVERGGAEEVFHIARRAFDLNGRRHELTLVKHLTPELRRQEVDTWKRAIRTISHEINNSLAPIASLARSARHILESRSARHILESRSARHILESRSGPDGLETPEHLDRLGPALDVIEERASHLRGFLEGYARFARLPAPVLREVAWGPFLEELRQLFPFILEGEVPARPSRFDAGQIQQVLINLLKNAQESGSPPEEIRLALEPTADGGVRLRVLDRGAGMSEEVMRKALLPFYTSKPTGTGLGLPLCREILEAHGGHLRLESREGRGTAVVCWLPGGTSAPVVPQARTGR